MIGNARIAALSFVLLFISACERTRLTNETTRSDDGGEITVLLSSSFSGAWPTGLDPATNTTARANLSIMNAIYGGLFQLMSNADGTNGRVVGILAEGYELLDEDRTIRIRLRPGVTFSDGTILDAEAVKFNVLRSLQSSCTCAPTAWPWREGVPVTTPDDYTVDLHFTRPYGAAINAFPVANINWIASPSALVEMGDDNFRLSPVGAGPFVVAENQPSSRLVLKRNDAYWEEGLPYLERITFLSIGSEQAAIQAILAGDADAAEAITSTLIVEQFLDDPRLRITQVPPTSSYLVQLNTTRPPFDDNRAREAIYYATDVDAIRKGIFNDWFPTTQSFTGSGGLFHHESVPGYRTYDPERARDIVSSLGGLSITLGTLRSFVAEQIITALRTQWEHVGIEVTIETYEIAAMIQEFQGGEWMAILQTAGSFDPESGGGVSFRFRSDQPYTGIHDETLDQMLLEAAGTFDLNERDSMYLEISTYLSENAYAPFLISFGPFQVAASNVEGPGLTTAIPAIVISPAVLWQNVRLTDR